MNDKWILDVLADLRCFARANDMPHLARQIEDAALVANIELSKREEQQDQAVVRH